MDCGPASLKTLIEGYGVSVNYARLREACQTDVDGTSIDTLEETAVALGLDAEQVMVPLEHLFHPDVVTCPAVVVVLLPSGATHFVVLWRKVGNWVLVMDPATGRAWRPLKSFLDEVYELSFNVPASAWREYAESDEFTGPLATRLGALGFTSAVAKAAVAERLAGNSYTMRVRVKASTDSRPISALLFRSLNNLTEEVIMKVKTSTKAGPFRVGASK